MKLFQHSYNKIEWKSQAIRQAFSTRDSQNVDDKHQSELCHTMPAKLTDAKNVRLNNDDTHLVYLNVAATEAIDQENGTQKNLVIQWSRNQDPVIKNSGSRDPVQLFSLYCKESLKS